MNRGKIRTYKAGILQMIQIQYKDYKMKSYAIIITMIPLLIFTACKDNSGGPEEPEPELEITGIQPDEGPAGTTVTISGSGFSSEASDNSVTFSGTKAKVEVATKSELKAVVPNEAESGPVKVAVGEKAATGPDFDVNTTASLEVSIVTTGSHLDEDGYQLIVAGNFEESSDIDDAIVFTDLPEGEYPVELTGLANNCSVDGENPQIVSFSAGETTSINILIECNWVLKNRIVFGSDRDGSFDIYSMDVDGTNIQQITDNDEYEDSPVVSNNGTQIAFEKADNKASNLYLMNADGTDVRKITNSSSYTYGQDWSPDDEFLAFNDSRTGTSEIYIIRPDGSGEERLTFDSSVGSGGPNWTPDGKIVYSRGEGTVREIYIMEADGTNQQPLTDYAAYSSGPIVSPDGSKISFRSNIDGDFKIYTINIDGTGRKLITDNPSNHIGHSWSPDGSEIVFQTTRDGNDEIYKINSDGSGSSINLTNDPAYDGAPFWSPAGN